VIAAGLEGAIRSTGGRISRADAEHDFGATTQIEVGSLRWAFRVLLCPSFTCLLMSSPAM
jgi:hypothetical protein